MKKWELIVLANEYARRATESLLKGDLTMYRRYTKMSADKAREAARTPEEDKKADREKDEE